MKNRFARILAVSALGVLLGSAIAWKQISSEQAATAKIEPAAGTISAAGSTVGGAFSLTDHNGRAVTEESFPGYKLMFFGFTHCPDICPTGLQKMTAALKALGDEGKEITPLFVTIDPDRDTPDVLKSYLALYDERLVGLTGTEAQVKTVTEAFRVYAARVEGSDPSQYMMDHSGFIYLLNPDGTMATVFGSSEKPSDIAAEIRQLLKQS